MAKLLKRYAKDTCYHGYAGIASAFVALAQEAPGRWCTRTRITSIGCHECPGSRAATQYENVTVSSIAARCPFRPTLVWLSAVATKRTEAQDLVDADDFTSCAVRTASPLLTGGERSMLQDQSTLEGGPYGGTIISTGEQRSGEMLTAAMNAGGEAWRAVRVSDSSIAQTAHALAHSQLSLPAAPEPLPITVAPLCDLGRAVCTTSTLLGRRHRSRECRQRDGNVPVALESRPYERDTASVQTRLATASATRPRTKGGDGVGNGESRTSAVAFDSTHKR